MAFVLLLYCPNLSFFVPREGCALWLWHSLVSLLISSWQNVKRKPSSICTSTQSDQNIRCPFTESLDTLEYPCQIVRNRWLIWNVSIRTCYNIGIKMIFHALTFARSRGRCWKPRPEAAVFNTSQGTWRMLMHWKTMIDRYYCIKTENICYISRYFSLYFVSPFYRCLTNAISTDCARSRARQYTSRNGSKSVALVRSYWKLRSRA